MTDEDRPAGRLVSRREVVAFLGTAGAVWLMAGSLNPRWAVAGTPGASCVVRPEQTGGPYFVDERLNRSDIRSDPTDGRIEVRYATDSDATGLAPQRRRMSAAAWVPK